MLALSADDLVIDIGSNDGTLLSNFKNNGHKVLGIEPTDIAQIAQKRGIPTVQRYFGPEVARQVNQQHGAARVVTAANCFAHMEDVHSILDGIVSLLAEDGVFISESHYLIPLLDRLQYDTIYHEHLRYYSLTSLVHLLAMHELEVFHARAIPTHGGSIRVYAARKGSRQVRSSVRAMLAAEPHGEAMRARLTKFRDDMWLYRDPTSPFYSSVGVTENERSILAHEAAAIFQQAGFHVGTDYISGLAYQYVASKRARTLLPIYNALDSAIFGLNVMRPLRAFVLTYGVKP